MKSDKDNDKILIARMGGEGWGASVYGRQVGNALVFWREGSSMGEDLDAPWSHSYSKPASELDQALPSWWMNSYPVEIHPLFRSWFRERYEQYSQDASISSEEDSGHYNRDRWLEILYASRKTPPKQP